MKISSSWTTTQHDATVNSHSHSPNEANDSSAFVNV